MAKPQSITKKLKKPRKPGRPRLVSSPAKVKVKRKQWSEVSMAAAIQSVHDGTTIYKAARLHGIPGSTLHDRMSGKVKNGTNPGPKPYLSKKEETELSDFLVDVAKAGYGKSRKQVITIAENVARDKGVLKKKKISYGWYRRFMDRRPDLSLRKGDATANVRMDCLNEETIQAYFDLLKEVLLEYKLMDLPCQIYNVDETGIPLDHRPPKVVTKKGQKKVRSRTSGNKSQITVIGCVNAGGSHMPPFVIFDAKNLNHAWTTGEVPGTTYGTSQKGWVDTELFKGWLTNHFLQFAVSARPLLLLLDGHSSHFQLIHFAKDHDIILFCLPPHTTHESQPLDASVFRSLKQHWQNVSHSYTQSNPGKQITKYNFSLLLHQAWFKAMTPSTICSGFRRCGVYPFNPNAIDCRLADSRAHEGEAQASEEEDGGGNEDHGGSAHSWREESGELAGYLPDGLHSNSDANQIDSKKEELYQRRFEEGYDVYDSGYLKWLEKNHPEFVPADRYTLVSVSEQQPSVSDFFSYVTPMKTIELSNVDSVTAASNCSGQDTYLNATATSNTSSILNTSLELPLATPISHDSSTMTTPKTSDMHTTQKPSDVVSTPKPPRVAGSAKRLEMTATSKTPGEVDGSSSLSQSAIPKQFETAATCELPGVTILPESNGVTHISNPLGQTPTPKPRTPEIDSRTLPSRPTGLTTTPKLTQPAASVKHPGVATTSTSSPGMSAANIKSLAHNSTPQSDCPSVHTTASVTTTPSSTSSGTPSSPTGELKYISKYLIQYIPSTTPKIKESSASKRVSGARILTSAQCLNMIQEREEKKKKLLEEKEKRKIEREQKKVEREAAAKKKAEEKAKKAELAAKQRESKSKKRQTSALNLATKKTKTVDNFSAASSSTSVDDRSKSASCMPSRLATLRSRESSVPKSRARVLNRSPNAENIDTNQCCVCLGTFQEDEELGTGLEWVECACKRWLHEVCVSDIEINSDDKELLCPFCCV